ncbi:MAG TPA: hypothetical protein VEK08_12315 [Planctomycetota bacterium]|nr:hypothetical protein [Planctomycetota bacterium]
MAEAKKSVVKKDDPFAKEPDKKMPFIAGGMILFAIGWALYTGNPGGKIRAETPEEKKIREAEEQDRALDAARKARSKKRH